MASLNLSRDKLQFVKGAILKNIDGKIVIQHYETDIFIYDPITKQAEILQDCSMTSNRMIERAIYFYDISESNIKRNKVEKWSFSRSLGN